jgi:polyhydroxyalkanoate synthesis regulator protein
VRSYTTQAQSVVPQFLAASFEMLREGQSKLMENLTTIPNPLSKMPGFEAMQVQQQQFLRSIMGGWHGMSGPEPEESAETPPGNAKSKSENADDLAAIKKQLAELQNKLSKL